MSCVLRLPPLYPIIDVRQTTPDAFARALSLAVELSTGGATFLQLRAKSLAAGEMMSVTSRMIAALTAHGSRVLVNDRADVALAAGAAGVHVGAEDLPVHAAREVLGAEAIIGYSTHSIADVMAARTLSVDYIGFGPVFESPTKAGVREPRGVELLAEACRVSAVPVVAIGGVTLATAASCWRAGAASVAVISELERASDPSSLVRAYWRASGR